MTLALTLSLAFAITNDILMIDWKPQVIGLVSAESIRSPTVEARHCDRDICDSLVSKCTLTNRCQCDFKRDAWCAKACIDCLEEKFGKCCACVGKYNWQAFVDWTTIISRDFSYLG